VKKKPPNKRAGRVGARPDPQLNPISPPVLAKTGSRSSVARVAFTTSRELEFFTESELTTQIGYGKGLWPIVLAKELIDNAIDACETAGSGLIEVSVKLDKNSITVSDNGPGINGKIIKGVLDYSSRISDKKHYIAPTRGQLGNALKCVVAAPFVATGKNGLVEVAARGRRHTIEIQLDRIAQEPKIAYTTTSEPSGIGTFLQVHWPGVASYFQSDWGDLYQFDSLNEAVAALIEDYSAFNPHVSFTFNGKRRPATDPSWQKWQTDHPTSAHWYRDVDLRGLIAAHISERDLPVRDFVSNFAGLTRNRVRADVLTAAGVKGTRLSDLVRGGDVDMAAVRRLLDAMQEHSKPVQPKRLGIIGEDHLKGYFESLGANNLKYHRKAFIDNDGLPVVLEIAFATKSDAGESSRRIFGLNWSPVFKIPSGEIGEAISGCQVESDDPVVLLIHAARPRFEFTDHGKGATLSGKRFKAG
jgi:DNA topoisomerase VI subunit B